MWRQISFALLCLALTGFAAAALAAEKENAILQIQSPAFAANSGIPGGYTCEGNDISPPLAWSGIPEGTKSFALIVDDPDAPDPSAPKKTWVHWVVYNIPATTTSLPEGATLPAGTGEGPNDWGTPGWRGPCPPVGKHRYFFKLYAVNAVFVPQHPLDKTELETSLIGHTLAQATLIGTYEHTKR